MPYCRGQIARIRQWSGCVEVTVAGEAPGSFAIDNCCFAMIVDPDGPELLGRQVEYADGMMRLGNHEEVRDMDATSKKTITVGVHGGLVQWIQGIPEDVRIVVHDYDIEGVDAQDLSLDAEGNHCVQSVWEHEDEA